VKRVPHECVDCGDVFDDGSDEVFEGCPSCGATKFFYVKEVRDSGESPDENATQEQTQNPTQERAQTQPSKTTDQTTTEAKPVAETQTGSGEDSDIVEADSEYERAFGGKLDGEGKEGDDADEASSGEISEVGDDSTFRRARADEARRELMDQFETIRIVEPGSYELNLMNLYEEDEKIIALQEDGRYQVSLPSAFED